MRPPGGPFAPSLPWLACLMVAASLGGSGCGPRLGTAPPGPPRPRHGYVYVAQLVSEHPLYGQLQRLEQEIVALNAPPPGPPRPLVFRQLEALGLAAPLEPPFPLSRFGERRARWEIAPALLEMATNEPLAPDLAAELDWERLKLTQSHDRLLAEKEAEKEARLAELRAQAVRARQEQRNNASLDMDLADDRALAAGAEEKQQLDEEVEQLVAAERAAAEERFAAIRDGLRQDLERDQAQLKRRIQARQEERLRYAAKSGSELRADMSKALTAPEPFRPAGPMSWEPEPPAASPGAQAPGGGQRASPAARRRLQAQTLSRRRAELARNIQQTTTTAITGLAAMERWEVRFPPLEAAQGDDLTDVVRPALRDLYTRK